MAPPDDLHPADDHSQRFFTWPEWLAAEGPLTAATAFEYFAASMFYDKQSNNQVLRMQTIHSGQPLINEAEELRRFVGTEFALVHAQAPSLFIIHKRHRLSPDEVRPLAAYFIINNRIYQAPDLYSVLSNRLLTTVHSLQSSLDTLRRFRPVYAPRTGFVWPIVEDRVKPSAQGNKETEPPSPGAEPASPFHTPSAKRVEDATKQEDFSLMIRALRTTAVHMNASTFVSKIDDATAAGDFASETISNGAHVDTPLTAAPTPSTADSATGSKTTKKKKKKGGLPQTPA